VIELITGLPGNAKTLYAIGEVKRRAEAEGRPVYYAGIKELTLDWQPVDPEKWMDVPDGSIIVIDECQKVFRNRSLGSVPPKHVTELEEHRHKGLDFYLITQHPSLIDPAIRRLTQTHKHLIRIFGMEASTIHKWNVCIDNPDKSNFRKDSEKTRWGFDKSIYGYYKSAEVHTMKRSIPVRFWFLLSLPLLLLLAAYMVYRITIARSPSGTLPDSSSAAAAAHGKQTGRAGSFSDALSGDVPGRNSERLGRSEKGDDFDPMQDAKHFVAMNTPRVEGLAFTAPKYDELTKPDAVPVPAMCIEFRGSCTCKSQQATPLDVKDSMCREFARNGFFREFDPDRDRRESERTARSVRVLEGRAVESSPTQQASSQVVTFGNPPPEPPYVPRVSSGGKAG